jgi:hypothetical protein
MLSSYKGLLFLDVEEAWRWPGGMEEAEEIRKRTVWETSPRLFPLAQCLYISSSHAFVTFRAT